MGNVQHYHFEPGDAVIEIFGRRLSVNETTHHVVRLAALVLRDSPVLDPLSESPSSAEKREKPLQESERDRVKREGRQPKAAAPSHVRSGALTARQLAPMPRHPERQVRYSDSL